MIAKQRSIVVRPRASVGPREVEICEHKGDGHPDTITDRVCEAACVAVAQAYVRAFGKVGHFNLDKGLLVGGHSRPAFGGGRIERPPKLILCGRAADPQGRFDVREVALGAARAYLRRHFPDVPFALEAEIDVASANLDLAYAGDKAVANDTSIGCGFAPYSTLERLVLDLAAILRSPGLRARFPAAGADFKIMGLREGQAMRITLAIAFIDRHVRDAAGYVALKAALREHLASALPPACELAINALDLTDARSVGDLYLTVTGLSAEMGDDGQVGRGNRVNGLITPFRPMSLEAAAGKNPASHVGKIYQVLAHRLSHRIVDTFPQAQEADVHLLSTIGCAIDRPRIALVELSGNGPLPESLTQGIVALVDAELDGLDGLVAELIAGDVAVA
jgi:S-adenosylmethionine synthetase